MRALQFKLSLFFCLERMELVLQQQDTGEGNSELKSRKTRKLSKVTCGGVQCEPSSVIASRARQAESTCTVCELPGG